MWAIKKIAPNIKARVYGDKIILKIKFAKGGLDYNLEEEIKEARKNFLIQEREVKLLLKRLKRIKENKTFQKEWQDLKDKYGRLFYGFNKTNISFDINLLPIIETCYFLSKCSGEKKEKAQQAIRYTKAFLRKYRIDP
jgi:hypothetical protein